MACLSFSAAHAANSCRTIFQTASAAREQHLVSIRSDLTLTPIERVAGGTQDGQWVKDQNGNHYFAKSYNGNQERVLAEHLTSQIYRAFDVAAAESYLSLMNGELSVLSREVDGDIAGSSARLNETYV
ncbi:MAG: hypothetical protein EOP06_22575, partial [Proteobacteria bacterium]